MYRIISRGYTEHSITTHVTVSIDCTRINFELQCGGGIKRLEKLVLCVLLEFTVSYRTWPPCDVDCLAPMGPRYSISCLFLYMVRSKSC